MPTNSYSNVDLGGGGGASQAEVDALITLSGVPAESTDLGTFTGSIIPDGSTIKEALQELETATMAESLWDRTGTTLEPQFANDNVDIGTGVFTGGGLDIAANSDEFPAVVHTDASGDLTSRLIVGGPTTNGFVADEGVRLRANDADGSNTVVAQLYVEGHEAVRQAYVAAAVDVFIPKVLIAASRSGFLEQILLNTNSATGITYTGFPSDATSGVAHGFSTAGALSATAKIASFRNNGGEVAAINHAGNITTSGTVDGRDVAADGVKIDEYITPVRAAMAADDVDFETDYVLTKTLGANTTLTASNPRLGKTILLEIQSVAAETLALPAGTVTLEGTYDTSGVVNYIFLMCNNASAPTYLAVIKQAP